ncbi:autotransporter outer membrane beta-barrel domain-containing protein [Novosphingobium mathurense]|uniref:Autotransporter beta-domain-containing protein n=1 Tax=Novosphingobium mathurense TaxID=428990 RepID=A0A1U6IRP4_9SPHN|nr:autotransporter domain-containing protein [Novosphingobium mathurense]SLK10680.1 Autotransporter beta-domain-containing protein [Novosphingobium mathurense]
MSSLKNSTSLGALVLALCSQPAMAATTIKTDTTSALATSGAGDVTVTEDGTITLASGTAITVDSDNAVDLEGGIELGDADGASAISVRSGTSSDVYVGEDASIYVLEDFIAEDDDDNSIADGAIAEASDRYGIHAADGASGTITNEGYIKVEGLDSSGIRVDGTYTGDITNTGSISVIGDNSTGISTQDVVGNVTVEGTVYVVGDGATALAVNGDVTGTVTVQGTVAQKYTYTNDEGDSVYLSRADLRSGTPAVSITGNVDGGIYIAAPPTDTDDDNDDEDNDGVDDDEEGTGAVVSYGNGPAIRIGGAEDITIGSVSSNSGTYSIAIDGTVTANSYYSNTDAFGLVIGGEGGDVTLTDGIGVTGTLKATSYDSSATALLINEGSDVGSLYNSGTITATLSSPGEGVTTAIRDLSGTLTTIENTGFITAGGSSTDTRVAVDLSANTSGVTISQYLNDEDAETSAEYVEDYEEEDPTIYTRIYGDIYTGAGDDLITASSGAIIGDTYFNAGDDTLELSGNTAYTGDVWFGSGTATATLSGESSFDGTMDFAGKGATLTINDSAVYSGLFTSAENLAVTVNGGILTANDTETSSFDSLYVAADGTLGVYVDGDESSLFVVNSAIFEDGASVTATVSDLATAEGDYTVLTADNLDIEGTLGAAISDLPFIYDGAVSADDNSITLSISRKSVAELGLDSAGGAAWDAVYQAAENDDYLTQSLLQIEDGDTLQSQVDGLLPDWSGGVFDAVTRGTRLASRHIGDDASTFDISEVDGWFEPIYWKSTKDKAGTAGYDASGWGLSAGFERLTSLGYFGASYAWLHGSVENKAETGDLNIGQHDLGLFWRTQKGPLMAWARLGASRISVDSTRTFTGTIDDDDFTYEADAKWKGWLLSGMAGASWKKEFSRRFSLKPKVELQQFWLKENGYTESADSDAMALTVADRTSRSTTVTPTVTASYSLGPISPDWRPLTFQFEGGRREVLAGSYGKTTAYFSGGDSYDLGDAFTITPDDLQGAWIGELRMLAGGYDFTWQIATRMEQTSDTTDLSARASLSVAF